MKHLIDNILIEVAHGDFVSLLGLVDHLLDHGYSFNRIAAIAERKFYIPVPVTIFTLTHLV